MPNRRQNRRRPQGFTLIELLVAIAILGILGTVVIKGVFHYIDDANQVSTKAKAETVHQQVQMYKRKHNELPRDLQELLIEDPRNNNNPWLEEENILDAWGNPFELRLGEKDGSFEIVSLGANGQADSFDLELGYDRDISSTRPLDNPSNE